MSKPILVIKFGSAAITKANGELNQLVMVEIARQVAQLYSEYHLVIVSSGAVAAGKQYIRNYAGEIAQRKAAAAIGNLLLLNKYAQFFAPYEIPVAQSLCERGHFANRDQFLQMKETFQELWDNGIIPIVNENDVVSSRELKFSDNDELATLIAVGFGADTLMLCTSVGGLLDNTGKVIPRVSQVNDVFKYVRTDKSSVGLGGMTSKLTFAKLAMRMGIRTIIFGMNESDGILRALREETGTVFVSQENVLSARNRWLGSGSLVAGRILIDAGAALALQNRKSLLAVGITEVEGDFEAGEAVEIVDEEGTSVAVAKAKESSTSIAQNLKTQNFEVANANDIVLL
ncbi:glutamate 5-kinase [Runella aurantiaca]|uniref:Glutamate 5-kinase n=1 Tax=Runella aurantiaca TaxID=2282308 RepID=A0A369IIQ5_9BACT|nr:glutamate 5-kinase [Runella aurantiaca]RDB07273.1 glutamate 5-kinase [Runella aurantiaca]